MTVQIEKKISPLIRMQFPSFYEEEGDAFILFVKAYYEWLEDSNQPLYEARRLLEYGDIDTTIDAFIPRFVNKYMKGFPLQDIQHKRDLIKHAGDIYRSKGTVNCLRLVFRLLFNEEIEIYLPGDDIFRSSDAEWKIPTYIEVTPLPRNSSFVGKVITGDLSGATAFVESLVTRTYRGKKIDVLKLSSIEGHFQTYERVSDDGVVDGSPSIIGSMTDLTITDPGGAYEVGQEVDIISQRKGKGGRAKINEVSRATGFINYQLVDGGYGYTLNANVGGSTQKVWISNNVLIIKDVYSANGSTANLFPTFTTIAQPLANIDFSSANQSFANGNFIFGANSTGGIIAGGYALIASNVDNYLIINVKSFANVQIGSILGANTTGSFNNGEFVYQSNGSSNTFVGSVVHANSTYALLDVRKGSLQTSANLIGSSSNCYANLVAQTTYARDNTHFTNTDITQVIIAGTTNGAIVDAATDITATANIVASNTTSVGIFDITNTFYALPNSSVISSYSNTIAEPILKSSGDPGTFKIGSIGNTEVIQINTEIIGSNNTFDIPFVDVALNANQYGFGGLPSANIQNAIYTALDRTAFTIGSIRSLTEKYRGSDNNAAPFVVEQEALIKSYQKYERVRLGVANVSGSFRSDELITQTFTKPKATITFSGSSGPMNAREVITQVRSDGNTVFGEVINEINVSGNGSLIVSIANSSANFDTSNGITGTVSGETISTVSNVVYGTYDVYAKATILDANTTTNSYLVRRQSFEDFAAGGPTIVGALSGATANVITVNPITSSNVIGDNAIVSADASVTNNTILSLSIISSGIGYEDGEEVTLPNINAPDASAVANVVLNREGVGIGVWRENRSSTSRDKYLQDNHYYQEYSYEVRSGIDRSKYQDVIEDTVHVAGTRLIPSFLRISNNDLTLVQPTYAEQDSRVYSLSLDTVTGTFTIGNTLTQGNTSGIIVSVYSSLNIVEVANVTGSYVANSVVSDGSATANVTSITTVFL